MMKPGTLAVPMRRGLARAVRAMSATLAVALVLSACVGGRPAAPAPTPSPAPSVPEATPGRNLVTAPDFPFVLYQGADHFGGREPRVNALCRGEDCPTLVG